VNLEQDDFVIYGYIDINGKAHKYVEEDEDLVHTGRILTDENGKLILEDNEKEIDRGILNDIMIIESRKKKGRFVTWTTNVAVFDRSDEEGVLYRTNKRLIGLRDPSPWAEMRYGGFLGDALIDAMKARVLKNKGAKEFFEIRIEDIKGYYKDKNGGYFIIIDKSNRKFTLNYGKSNRLLRGFPKGQFHDSTSYTQYQRPKPSAHRLYKESSIPTVAGILLVIAGIDGLINWSGAVFMIDLGSTLSAPYIPFGFEGTCGIIGILLCIFTIIGGFFALRRKRWGTAFIGSICGLFAVGLMLEATILSTIALILIILSKGHFYA